MGKKKYYALQIKGEDGKETLARLYGRHKDGIRKLSVLGLFDTEDDAKEFGIKFLAPKSYKVIPVNLGEK